MHVSKSDTTHPSIAPILQGMDDRRRQRLALLQGLGARYIRSPRDEALRAEIERLVDSHLASLAGRHAEGSLLAVIAPSGAGKTWAIEQALEKMPELGDSLLAVTAPRPCTLKQLGRTILSLLGYDLKRELTDHVIWEKVRDHLELNGIRFVWIDELQHLFEDKHEAELQRISDTLKNLVQRRSWPVSFILSGLPAVSRFLGRDRQIERRSRTFELPNLAFPQDVKPLRLLTKTIIEDHAGMACDPALVSDEFLHRLVHAAEGAMGVVIATTRAAAIAAFDRSSATVQARDFAAVYASERNCEPSENVFTAERWDLVQPGNSRQRDEAPQEDEPRPSAKKKGR